MDGIQIQLPAFVRCTYSIGLYSVTAFKYASGSPFKMRSAYSNGGKNGTVYVKPIEGEEEIVE